MDSGEKSFQCLWFKPLEAIQIMAPKMLRAGALQKRAAYSDEFKKLVIRPSTLARPALTSVSHHE